MRFFEFLLFLISVIGGAARIRFAERRPTWTSTIPLAAFLCAIIHVAGEGARWQMIPVYLVVLTTFTTTLVRAFQTSEIPVGGGVLSRVTGSIAILFGILSLVAATSLPVYDLPAPTGHYVVGVRALDLGDDLVIRVHYPADRSLSARIPSGLGELKGYIDYVSARYDIPVSLLGHLGLVKTHAYPNAQLSDELPIYRVLIQQPDPSHPSIHVTSLTEELASHGFIVLSIPSPTETDTTEAFTFDAEGLAERLEVIDPEGQGGWLAERLDFGRIGLYGFGAAGQTVLESCNGGNFRAGAAIGSSIPLGDPNIPFLYFRPEGKEDAPLSDIRATTYVVTSRGMLEDNFGDNARTSPLLAAIGDFGSIDIDRANQITRAYVRAFFNKHLTRGTLESILDGRSNEYPEVSIQVYDAQK